MTATPIKIGTVNETNEIINLNKKEILIFPNFNKKSAYINNLIFLSNFNQKFSWFKNNINSKLYYQILFYKVKKNVGYQTKKIGLFLCETSNNA